MKKNIRILLAAALLISATSCEDFLQKDPPSTPSQSVFWQKKSDFDSALAGTYSVMYSGPFSYIMPCFDGLTDNAIVQHSEATYGHAKIIAQGDLTPNQGGFVTSVYSNCYTGIARVHLIMSQLETYKGGDINADERKFMLAQCKALRGYFYSWLYQCYKEVPVVTEVLNLETMYQPKASRADLLQRVLDDYNDAIDELPAGKLYTDSETTGRFTVGAVQALKARLLLFDAYDENGKAITSKMEEIVTLLQQIKGYELAARTRDNFISSMQKDSPEIMFSVRYLRPNLTNSMDLYYGAWAVLDPTRDLIDAFECTDGKKWSDSPLAEHPDESVLYGTDNTLKKAEREKLFQNRDRRLYESINHSMFANFKADGMKDEEIQVNESNNQSPTGFSSLKYIQPTDVTPGYSTVSDADVVVVRYAHVLLMLAEAENEAHGATAIARNAVNEVRTRSGQPEVDPAISQDDLRELIRNEWRVETCLEGLRYFQLKRWKLMDKLVNGAEDPAYKGYIKVYEPAFEFFPLPQSEIDKAGGILVQDPAYK
ncbi:RagB/SusD family nutrient uptake outer membrane protein [Phocaeicola sp.]